MTVTDGKSGILATEQEAKDVEAVIPPASPPQELYSVFGARKRYVLTIVLGAASLASPLSANIYFPLLPLLQVQYESSAQAINLTITLYVIVQAIMPIFFGPAADIHGRRPISLLAYCVFALASLGLSVNDLSGRSYPALLLLRALQALGASVCASITYGVISDVCIPAERGSMIGPTISAANVGTVIGPVFGGLIAWSTGSAAWVFITLAIYGVSSAAMIALCFPETARAVVGNGMKGKRLKKTGFWGWVVLGPHWGLRDNEAATIPTESEPKPKRSVNPLACLSLLLWKDTALIVFLSSCNYAVWYTVLASIPHVFSGLYGWSQLLVGLAYLPPTITTLIAGFANGSWTNWRFRRTAQEAGLPCDSHHVDGFPIERARTRGLWPILVGTYAIVASLGWATYARAHVAVLLTLLSVGGFLQALLFFSFNTLLVDVHPDKPSTASAAASLVRSGLSGVGIAILQPMREALGWGGYFTLLAGLICVLQGTGMLVLSKYGQAWREKRRESEMARHDT
ncbi:major facilitator superfamily domain-containing protein [Stachybotrys elegans]|uniref:Major facilitator superfamily domain-containing protein n=1 Tax=Stachybotrys elegans TaxID=80388 RepID=A0A8K0SES2_9HYPO|nr:major facilitator superfamily domain-containing protein [Stachybotrys elegans]